ncbi:THO complex subunit 5 homolog A isoform X2 [Strongylocentrotus purpuratus]|uniref:THO complex subunit 5 homolog n=1 Tax=Strongylocentrotus purpuratus TaxID=7668 RepID=A0A7M7RH99_STRPU|nr:THO complex subunit 5 homolog A isoform X2 [Strongylocentrotus purpuratus]
MSAPTVKKRRILSKTDDEQSRSSSPKRESKKAVHVKVKREQSPYDEEKEVAARDKEKDLQLHNETSTKLRNLMADIHAYKSKEQSGKDDEIDEKQKEVALLFVTLKKLNRVSHLRCKKARDETQGAKQKVDNLHLQLQNLLYEVMHLQKEITKCLEFKSKDEDIELVDVETFFKEAPPSISKPSTTKHDEHKLQLARLDWELEQRKRLSEQYKARQGNRDGVAKSIHQKKDYLESLQPRLSNILEATIPVQQHLSMPFNEIRSQHQLAKLLPRPLYFLYVQANAYHEACDGSMSLKIEGDAETASSTLSASNEDEEDSDSDSEETLSESKRRRKTMGDKLEEQRQKILAKHPLQVIMTLRFKGGTLLTLTFNYMMVLQIITVNVDIKLGGSVQQVANSASGLLSPSNLLSLLFPGDDGKESPKTTNAYQLSKIGMNDLASYIGQIGHPYRWVQWLGGLDFLSDSGGNTVKASAALSNSHMESTVKALKSRVKARLTLNQQLLSLEGKTIAVPAASINLFPTKICSSLKSWTTITAEDFQVIPFLRGHPSADRLDDSHTIFQAMMERGSAKLQVLILLGLDYPNQPPHFILNLQWVGQRNSNNDLHIRDMEAELNIHYGELIGKTTVNHLMTNQLQRVLMCLDVYLETQQGRRRDEQAVGGTEGPTEFVMEKMYTRVTRGRNRSKPFKYNSLQGYFMQRL